MNRIRKGDEVIVVAGRDKGRRGSVVRVLENGRVVVENVNMVKRHTRPNPQRGVAGGIVADTDIPAIQMAVQKHIFFWFFLTFDKDFRQQGIKPALFQFGKQLDRA